LFEKRTSLAGEAERGSAASALGAGDDQGEKRVLATPRAPVSMLLLLLLLLPPPPPPPTMLIAEGS
jgi:hypothetical protein